MGWNKNTINLSEIDRTVKILKHLRQCYKLDVLGAVRGRGLNDNDKMYDIRRLSFGNTVIIEQMVRSDDCDLDDYLVSREYVKGKEPKKNKLEVTKKCYEG